MTVTDKNKAVSTAAVDQDEDQDLLEGIGDDDNEEDDEETDGQESEEQDESDSDAEDGEEEGSEDGQGQHEAVDLSAAVTSVQEIFETKTEEINDLRETNKFLEAQLQKPDVDQFKDDGLYKGLPVLYLGKTLLYHATPSEVDAAINQIEASDTLTAADKRNLIRQIDTNLAKFEDRKTQQEAHIKANINNLNTQEWQQVELGFTDKKHGIKGIEKHIPEIWDWCVNKMKSNPAIKAKCESSAAEKFQLAVRAIRALGIDKKLGKDLSGEDGQKGEIPFGKGGSKGVARGSGKEPTFTRAQLQELLKNPEKVDDKQMEAIEKAMAAGRIKSGKKK